MKNLLPLLILAVLPAAAGDFSVDGPALRDVMAQTRALQASSLGEAERLRGMIRKYGGDPTRAGIYQAQLSLLQLRLAIEGAGANASPAAPPSAPAAQTQPGERRARLLLEIARTQEKLKKYEGDPLRSGIYSAEISLLYLELALEGADAAGKAS